MKGKERKAPIVPGPLSVPSPLHILPVSLLPFTPAGSMYINFGSTQPCLDLQTIKYYYSETCIERNAY